MRLSPNHFIESIDGHRVDVYETLTRRHRRIDDVEVVVLVMLRTPEDTLFRELREAGTVPTHCIGGAVAPRSAAEAIYEAEKLARVL